MLENSDFDRTVNPFPTQLQLACRNQAFSQICLAEYTQPLERGKQRAAKVTKKLCKDGWGLCSLTVIIRIISLTRIQCRPNPLSTGTGSRSGSFLSQ